MKSHKLLIKVCGMTDPGNIAAIAATGPDILGFIFYSGSKRAVNVTPKHLILPVDIQKAGVFVNETIDVIKKTIRQNNLDWVQLHGDETPEYCAGLSGEANKLIKAIQVRDRNQLMQVKNYTDIVDLILLDTWGSQRGGNGKSFDWNILKHYNAEIPFILSGGIGADDAEKIRHIEHPLLVGIDINSRFETEPGIKDPQSVNTFIQKIKCQFI